MFLTGGAAPFCSWRRTCRLAIFIGGPLQQYIDQKGASQKAQRCENDDVHGARQGGQKILPVQSPRRSKVRDSK